MFTDEISLTARGGKGGDGFASFARRKYQPFAGPDGGDGGNGGSVILRATRARDSLDHLRRTSAVAPDGAPGQSNLRIGARGTDFAVEVPPGTMAFNTLHGDPAGEVLAGGQEFILARGGRGGRGNPHFKTGGRRAPKEAESGGAGQENNYILRYRIYADSALIEDPQSPAALLPALINKDPGQVDFDLYARKPRWIRVTHDYREFDVAYLPCTALQSDPPLVPLLPHIYWASHLFINLDPAEDSAPEAADTLLAEIDSLPLRRLELITIAGIDGLMSAPLITSDKTECDIQLAAKDASVQSVFSGQLTGGTVS